MIVTGKVTHTPPPPRPQKTICRKSERAGNNPYGVPLVSDEEVAIAADAIKRRTDGLINGQPALNLAYSVLVAVRYAHFNHEKGRS